MNNESISNPGYAAWTTASSPEKKILATLASFLDRFGDDRFSDLHSDEPQLATT
jgi:hypothetical protein